MADLQVRLGTLKQALEDIGGAGDAARLQLHLLSMQARDRTGELGASIETLEHKLDRGIEQAMQTAVSKTRQLTSTVQEFLGKTPAQASGQVCVKAIMTDAVRSCSVDDALNIPAQIMWETDCGAVTVVDAERRLCGVITDRDICMASYTKGIALHDIRVADVMSRHLHTCRADDTLERVAAIMADSQVRRLPVVDADQRALGIVSLADIARNAAVLGQPVAQVLIFQLLRAISKRRSEATDDRQRSAAE